MDAIYGRNGAGGSVMTPCTSRMVGMWGTSTSGCSGTTPGAS